MFAKPTPPHLSNASPLGAHHLPATVVSSPLSAYIQNSARAKHSEPLHSPVPASARTFRPATQIASPSDLSTVPRMSSKFSFGESTIQGIVKSADNFSPVSIDINTSSRLKEPSFFTSQAMKSVRIEDVRAEEYSWEKIGVERRRTQNMYSSCWKRHRPT